MLNYFIVGRKVTIREFVHLLRALIACCPAVAYGIMHCRKLERLKVLQLLIKNNNYEVKMKINKTVEEDLLCWKKNAALGINPIRTLKFRIIIDSNALLLGWSAFSEGIKN